MHLPKTGCNILTTLGAQVSIFDAITRTILLMLFKFPTEVIPVSICYFLL